MHDTLATVDAASLIDVGSGFSTAEAAFDAGRAAASAALSSINHHALSAVIVYASSRYDAAEVLRGVHGIAGNAPTFGVTTAGEICDQRLTRTVTVAAIASPHLIVRCGVGRNVSRGCQQALMEAVASPELQPFFDPSPAVRQRLTREGKTIFAMLFSPGNTRFRDSRSYELLELLKAQSLGFMPIVGGSAADDWSMETNSVLLGRDVYADGVLIAIFETKLQVGIALTHGFRSTGLKTTATKVGEQEILTLDGQTAADVLPPLLGASREGLVGKHLALTTGRTIGIADAMGQFGITVCTFLTPNGGVRMAQPVAPGTVLNIMEPDPISVKAAGAEAARKAMLRGAVTQPAVALVNYCALRARLLGDEDAQTEIGAITALMGGAPLLGFCSFGEAGLSDDGVSRHANASISMVVIGKQLSQAARVAREAEQLRSELEKKAGELEHRVAMRTGELRAINEKLQLEIARHKSTEELLRRSEAQYRLLAEDLVLQKQRAEDANLSKSAFLANMSHELRTPLNAIIGFSDLIRSEVIAPIGSAILAEYVNDIHASGLHLLDLINDVLDLAKIEAGKQKLYLEPIVPREIVAEVGRLMSVRTQEIKIDFRIVVAEGLAELVADRRAVKQILLNLLSNAFKFTPPGGRVTLDVRLVSNRLRFAVLDSGFGMSKEVLARIGRPFERAENVYTRVAPGTGLGLALTKSLVGLHGGTLKIRSKEGRGTTAAVSFPCPPAPSGRTDLPAELTLRRENRRR